MSKHVRQVSSQTTWVAADVRTPSGGFGCDAHQFLDDIVGQTSAAAEFSFKWITGAVPGMSRILAHGEAPRRAATAERVDDSAA